MLTAPTRKVHLLKLKVTSEKVLQECCRSCLWVDSPLTVPTNGKSTYKWKIRDQSCKSSWILHVLADFYRFMKDIAFTNELKSGHFLCISLKPLPNFCNQNDRENDHTLKWSLAQKRWQKSWKPWLWSIILVCRYCTFDCSRAHFLPRIWLQTDWSLTSNWLNVDSLFASWRGTILLPSLLFSERESTNWSVCF